MQRNQIERKDDTVEDGRQDGCVRRCFRCCLRKNERSAVTHRWWCCWITEAAGSSLQSAITERLHTSPLLPHSLQLSVPMMCVLSQDFKSWYNVSTNWLFDTAADFAMSRLVATFRGGHVAGSCRDLLTRKSETFVNIFLTVSLGQSGGEWCHWGSWGVIAATHVNEISTLLMHSFFCWRVIRQNVCIENVAEQRVHRKLSFPCQRSLFSGSRGSWVISRKWLVVLCRTRQVNSHMNLVLHHKWWQWTISLFGSSLSLRLIRVLSSEWDQSSAKKWSHFFVWPQWSLTD